MFQCSFRVFDTDVSTLESLLPMFTITITVSSISLISHYLEKYMIDADLNERKTQEKRS